MKSFKFTCTITMETTCTNKYVKINIDTNGYNFEILLQSIMRMIIIKYNDNQI